MKIKREMKIKAVLELDEKLLNVFLWLAPEFERLRNPHLRRAMSGRVTVAQAARIARIPLSEMLYVLNLAAGEDETKLAEELKSADWKDFELQETNPPFKPLEIINVRDTDANVLFVDLMPYAEAMRDPMPAIAKGLVSLKNPTDVLLLKHPFDPIPLRDMFARRGFASWAEERKLGEWFIYFYRPAATAKAAAHPPVSNKVFVKTMAAFAK
ncbi:MAG TPA: DUF1858 domain-containing protein [Pyrinomonadaceae bacterium]|jgi:hypothetical protein